MTARQRLPNRRASQILDIESQGLRFTAVSRFVDGSIAEIFLQNHKAGSAAGIMASDAAIAASLSLQYGCPAEVLSKARRDVEWWAVEAVRRGSDWPSVLALQADIIATLAVRASDFGRVA